MVQVIRLEKALSKIGLMKHLLSILILLGIISHADLRL